MAKNEKEVKNNIFGFGDENVAYAKYFDGISYLNGLAAADDNVDVSVANVSFEPGTRNHWHRHLDGYQILICTGGEGWVQEEGKPAKLMKPGDTVVIHDGVKHLHGATKDSWFSHIAITKGTAKWEEPVDEDYYNSLKA